KSRGKARGGVMLTQKPGAETMDRAYVGQGLLGQHLFDLPVVGMRCVLGQRFQTLSKPRTQLGSGFAREGQRRDLMNPRMTAGDQLNQSFDEDRGLAGTRRRLDQVVVLEGRDQQLTQVLIGGNDHGRTFLGRRRRSGNSTVFSSSLSFLLD